MKQKLNLTKFIKKKIDEPGYSRQYSDYKWVEDQCSTSEEGSGFLILATASFLSSDHRWLFTHGEKYQNVRMNTLLQ